MDLAIRLLSLGLHAVCLVEPLGWAGLRQIMSGLVRLPVARPPLDSTLIHIKDTSA